VHPATVRYINTIVSAKQDFTNMGDVAGTLARCAEASHHGAVRAKDNYLRGTPAAGGVEVPTRINARRRVEKNQLPLAANLRHGIRLNAACGAGNFAKGGRGAADYCVGATNAGGKRQQENEGYKAALYSHLRLQLRGMAYEAVTDSGEQEFPD
jgi:hypothetical protein